MSGPRGTGPDARDGYTETAPEAVQVLSGQGARRWVERHPAAVPTADVEDAVREILDDVRRNGDDALLRLSRRYDGCPPDPIRIPATRLREELETLSAPRRDALERARDNLRRFHEAQRRTESPVEVEPGVRAWREFRPIQTVGVYVPGGLAAYPSSLLMAAVPARVAGCSTIVACCPPGPDGEPPVPVMATAALLEIDALYSVGGAQAVGAMAWGTGTVTRVDKIFGPGSRWVEAAKLAVRDAVEIDLPAGPSEVVVWADAGADPGLVAAELLAQAEHGPDSVTAAILPDRDMARRVARVLARQLAETPRREIAAASLRRSALLVAGDEARALEWINRLAAEHLVLMREDAGDRLPDVRHAGSVFLGVHSPVAAGDYAVGTNHVLPTRRRSRARGGLSLDDFGVWMQVQELDEAGLRALAPTITELAEWEGLPAHAASVKLRLEET